MILLIIFVWNEKVGEWTNHAAADTKELTFKAGRDTKNFATSLWISIFK